MSGIQGQNLGNSNAVGNSGGKSLNDRKLAAQVRTLALKEILRVMSIPKVEMSFEEYELYKSILVKLTGNVLPRLNEHTGEDGKEITFIIPKEIAKKNAIK
jgi:hypothetical protein